MSASPNGPGATQPPTDALGAEWRAARRRRQEQALPRGSTVVSCSALPGSGGLGRHLQEIVDALERRGERFARLCGPLPTHAVGATGDEHAGAGGRGEPTRGAWSSRRTRVATFAGGAPARLSPTWRSWQANVAFDLAAARAQPVAEHLVAFAGQALEQLRVSRRAGARSRALMSATAHIGSVERRHAVAHELHPVEPSWAGRLRRRSLLEYSLADRIYVSTRYAWESFVEEGVAAERLSLFPLTPAVRFAPTPEPRRSSTFDVVYVGGLSVVKGVPVLIDAFSRMAHRDMRLLLVGGAETRGMRRYLERARARDSRIDVCPGDPLPALRRASLYVHPSYSDGFGYAPAEALACGVPAIVSEDTGMKELIAAGVAGLVLPTGDTGALAEAIDCAYRGEILRTRVQADGARVR